MPGNFQDWKKVALLVSVKLLDKQYYEKFRHVKKILLFSVDLFVFSSMTVVNTYQHNEEPGPPSWVFQDENPQQGP